MTLAAAVWAVGLGTGCGEKFTCGEAANCATGGTSGDSRASSRSPGESNAAGGLASSMPSGRSALGNSGMAGMIPRRDAARSLNSKRHHAPGSGRGLGGARAQRPSLELKDPLKLTGFAAAFPWSRAENSNVPDTELVVEESIVSVPVIDEYVVPNVA